MGTWLLALGAKFAGKGVPSGSGLNHCTGPILGCPGRYSPVLLRLLLGNLI